MPAVMAPQSPVEIAALQHSIPGGRFSAAQVTPELERVAIGYLMAYQGSFSFLQDLRGKYRRYRSLSAGQVGGILNCMAAEGRRAAQAALPEQGGFAASGQIVPKIASGVYTVVLGGNESDYVTLRIRSLWDEYAGPPMAAGTQYAQFLSGPDNESSYTGFAFVQGSQMRVWRRHAANSRLIEALRLLLASDDPSQMGLAYAMQSGRCYRCGRQLTVPASLHRGLGPDCAEIMGLMARRGEAVPVIPAPQFVEPPFVDSEPEEDYSDVADQYQLDDEAA